MNSHVLRAPVAELVGTMLFVFFGAGAVVANAGGVPLGPVGVALAHGVGIAVLISMTLAVSGGHLNPAVSLALWIANKIDGRRLGMYVAAQLIGAVLGALLVKAFLPSGAARVTSLGLPQVSGALGLIQAILLEAVFAFFLVSAVFGTCVNPAAQKIAGFGVGLAIFTFALVGGALTGGVGNPARAFGPALASMDWHAQIVYWVGPALGAALAAVLWKVVLLPRDATELA